jgi:hypothetical protein
MKYCNKGLNENGLFIKHRATSVAALATGPSLKATRALPRMPGLGPAKPRPKAAAAALRMASVARSKLERKRRMKKTTKVIIETESF